ncbi:MAG TPA: rhodanese-like domain-containing protein [Malonomonas sp.]
MSVSTQLQCHELKKLLAADLILVDIRRQEEWLSTGVIEGSLCLTFFDQSGNADAADWLRQLDQLVPVGKPLALICRSGYRTGLVCDFLSQVSDRAQLYNVAGGILEWLAAGLPVVKLDGQRGDEL